MIDKSRRPAAFVLKGNTMATLKQTQPALDPARMPRHIAIIMDGNGRWAQKRGLPRTAGHKVGAETFRRIATCCKNLGLDYLTVYAFSTENWKRSEDEISTIMRLFEAYLHEAIDTMERDQIRLKILGEQSRISPELRRLIAKTDEIVRAAKKFAALCMEGSCRPEELTEGLFSGLLDTAGIPDPELIIRPSGEIRTSNFLLWQSAYAEYYFTDVLWPDFDEAELTRAILSYQSRSRRFGGVK